MPQCIAGNKQTTSDWLIANCEIVWNPCNLQSYTPGIILSIMYKLAANYSILTWSSLYIPQDFPLLFIFICLFYSTPPNHRYIMTSASWWRIQTKLINGCFIQYGTPWYTERMQTPVSPPQHGQWSYKNMTHFEHFKIIHKSGSSEKKRQHAIGCEYIHTMVNSRQLTV